MNKETLRMQFLSGIITESEYKSKLHEEVTTEDNIADRIIKRLESEDVIGEKGLKQYEWDGEYGMGSQYKIILEEIKKILTEIGKEQGLPDADANELANKVSKKIEVDDDYGYGYTDDGTTFYYVIYYFNGKPIVKPSGNMYGWEYGDISDNNRDGDINKDTLKSLAQFFLEELNKIKSNKP